MIVHLFKNVKNHSIVINTAVVRRDAGNAIVQEMEQVGAALIFRRFGQQLFLISYSSGSNAANRYSGGSNFNVPGTASGYFAHALG